MQHFVFFPFVHPSLSEARISQEANWPPPTSNSTVEKTEINGAKLL